MTGGAQHDGGDGMAGVRVAWQGCAWHGRGARGMAGRTLHGVGVSTGSFRAPVAESSHSGIKPFCGRFLDAATTRSMTGGTRSMTGGARSMTGACAA